MKRTEPDYVSGARGRYEISPPIVHPPRCVCDVCPRHRKTVADWEHPFTIRARKRSTHPESRIESATFARQFKRDEETRLAAAVRAADEQRRARAGAVPFGTVCDVYREHLRAEGKRVDRAEPLIANIEALFGRGRAAELIGWEEYQELRGEVAQLAPQTRRHYESALLAILNYATKHRIIASSALGKVPLTSVRPTGTPVTWTKRELAVLLGPAMDAFEREQCGRLAKPVTKCGRDARRRNDSRMPLRGLCYVAYFMLARPVSNFGLEWEDIPDEHCRRFKLRRHKNARRAITAEGPVTEHLASYLRSIRPADATGLVHPNPDTAGAYRDIRKQWSRLVAIASGILGYRLSGRKADFFTFRHTGASHLAEKTKNPVLIVKMMGDTNIQTVMRHYFNLDFEFMEEMVSGWSVPQFEAPSMREEEREWAN